MGGLKDRTTRVLGVVMAKFHVGLRLRPLCACLSGALALGPFAAPALAAEISTSALSLVAARASVGSAKHVLGSVVASCDDGPFASGLTLREAIAEAKFGEVIDMSGLSCPSSTITLSAGAIFVPQKAMALLGPADGSLTIDANGTDRVFYSSSPLLEIENLTISGGLSTTYDGKGGCIRTNGDLTLTNSIVSGGQAVTGGGGCIFAGGNVTLQHSSVTGCSVNDARILYDPPALDPTRGGGILAASITLSDGSLIADSQAQGPTVCVYNYYTHFYDCSKTAKGGGASANTITCSDSTIHGNNANYGAGLQGGVISATRCLVDHNVGSGIFGGQATIVDSTLSENGSGVRIQSGSATISNSTISGNAYGIWAYLGSQANIINSTISGNDTGIRAYYHVNLALSASTVAMNKRGVYLYYSSNLSAQSSIIAQNRFNDYSYDRDVIQFSGGSLTGADNLIIVTNTAPAAGVITVTDDPQLLPLTDNGGLTRTHALPATSPAINKGNNAALLATDQRGDGFVRAFGRPDIGAYEAQVVGDEIFYDGFD